MSYAHAPVLSVKMTNTIYELLLQHWSCVYPNHYLTVTSNKGSTSCYIVKTDDVSLYHN